MIEGIVYSEVGPSVTVISPARSVDDVRRAEASVMVARAKKSTPKIDVTRRTWERRKAKEGTP